MEEVVSDSVFKFSDTLTSRAEISDLAAKFKGEVIAVIGLGGTGAYIFDFLVKTPVREIRAFDNDRFHVHNAFRSPGHLEADELGLPKAEVYGSRYDNFRHGLSAFPQYVDPSCSQELDGVTFAFVCVDKGSARAGIFELLLSLRIPFIDVGMGLNRKHGPIRGMLRTTYYPADNGSEVRDRGFAPLNDSPDDVYKTNIQISELNALNAALAVIRYKQIRGFYLEEASLVNSLLEISDLKMYSLGDADDSWTRARTLHASGSGPWSALRFERVWHSCPSVRLRLRLQDQNTSWTCRVDSHGI